ncbi:hypothetical protein [Gymnodinialimonas sp.]
MTDPIKTNRDGSIDTKHYIAIGRQMRSEAARDMFMRPARPTRSRGVSPLLALVLVTLVVALPGLI